MEEGEQTGERETDVIKIYDVYSVALHAGENVTS
jgi:hypothetical protein